MTLSDIPQFVAEHYEVHEWRHASAVLAKDYPDEWADIMAVLTDFRLKKSHITVGGGNKSNVAVAIDSAFRARGLGRKAL